MAVWSVLVDPAAREKLGGRGLYELCQNLHLSDCQTCGAPLTERPSPTLVVYDFGDVIRAALHHRTCQEPTVAHGPRGSARPQDHLRHLSYSRLIGALHVEGSTVPFAVVNPHLEAAQVARNREGHWVCDTVNRFMEHGMYRVDRDMPFDGVVPGSMATLQPQPDGYYRVTLQLEHHERWVFSNVAGYTAAAIDSRQGVFLMVTSSACHTDANYDRFDPSEFHSIACSGRTAVGWVPLLSPVAPATAVEYAAATPTG